MARLTLAFVVHVAVGLVLRCVAEQELLGHMVTVSDVSLPSELFRKHSCCLGFASVTAT